MHLRLYGILVICSLFLFECSSKKQSLTDHSTQEIRRMYESTDGRKSSFHRRVLDTSKDYNSYKLMNLRAVLGALNSIIIKTEDPYFIKEQIGIIDDIIESARISSEIPENISFKDDYKGWVSLDRRYVYGHEVILNEGYSFFYITQFLYHLSISGWIKEQPSNEVWWNKTLSFVEKNIWEKWYTRSIQKKGKPFHYFLRGRTHMGSHFAGVALFLEKITKSPSIREQCVKLYSDYDMLLKRNLRIEPRYNAFIWNSTYDDVSGTDAILTKPSVIQDVSHGNHVVSYIIAAYELGDKHWTKNDIQKLCNTVKLIYNKETNRFSDNVDGSQSSSRSGWGNFQSDGWVKLSPYDPKVKQIFEHFVSDDKILEKYNQEFQMRANFLQ